MKVLGFQIVTDDNGSDAVMLYCEHDGERREYLIRGDGLCSIGWLCLTSG